MREEVTARKQAQEELKTLNETLEQQVTEPTRDLEHSSEMLRSSPAVVYTRNLLKTSL
ncbi:MAG: hypothetical protein WAL98_12295 [Desulfatiglandaceae bacterium]